MVQILGEEKNARENGVTLLERARIARSTYHKARQKGIMNI